VILQRVTNLQEILSTKVWKSRL